MASSFLNKKAQEQRNKRNQSSGSSGKASSFLNKKAQEQREAREAKSTAASNALAANNPGYVAAQKYGNGKTGTAANKVVKGTSQQSTERKPGQTNALGGGTYNKTKLDSTLNAAVYNTAGTLANLWGTIQALDESLKGTDEYTAVGGLNKITDREGDKKKAMEANRVKSVFNTADTLMQRSAEEQEEAKEGLGKFGQGLVDFGVAGAQFAGDVVANAILPGSGLAAMGARAAGGGAYEARQTGLDLDQQLTAGAKSAAIELLTEKLFGAGSKIAYGSGIIKNQNVVNGLVNNMAKTDKGRTALKVLAAANEEGLEEVLSDVLNPIADRILNLQDSEGNYLSSWDAEQMLEDYIIGAALGAFGAGANVVSGEYKAENAQQRAYEDYQKALVNAGLAAEQGSNAQVTAAEYQKILDQSSKRGNRNLSDRETENMLNLLHIEQDAPDVSARLQSLGQSADTETVNAIVKAVNGEKLSRKEQQAFSANPYSQRVVNEMTDTEGVTSNGWYADRASGAAYTPQNTGVSAETAQQALDIARRQRAAAGAATFNPTASAQGMNAVAAARNAAGQAAVQRVAAVQNVTESIASDINVAPEVVQQVYNLKADTSPEVFKAAFKTAYTMGEQGAKETALSSIKALSPQQASIAYNIGMEKAAAAANTQEVNESGVHLRGSGQRINGQNTAGQVSGLAESTGRNTSGQAQGQPRNGAKTARNDGQEVVYNGAKQKGVRYTASKKTESMRKAEKTAKSRGYSTVFFEGGNIKVDGGEARGIIDPDTKTVYVRTDHPDFTANQIMRHEMGHADIAEGKISLDKVREDLHERFTDAELDEIAQAYADAYEGANMTIEEAFEEICCDALGDMNVFAGTGRIDDTRYGQTLTSTKKSAERQANQGRAPPKETGAKYSYEGKNKDGIEVYETSDEVKALSRKERQKKFLEIMQNEYRGRTAKFIRNGHAYYATFDDKDVNKNIYGDKRSSNSGYNAKIKVGADGNIFELVENAKYNGSKKETGKSTKSHKQIQYWDYYVKTVQIDNQVYDLVANVRRKSTDDFVYSIQLHTNNTIKASAAQQPNQKAGVNKAANASDNSIPTTSENVKNKYSLEPEDSYEGSISPKSGSIKFSLQENPKLTAKTMQYFDQHSEDIDHISKSELVKANRIVDKMVNYMIPYLDRTNTKGGRYLPEEILGDTRFANGSYGRTIENTTICFRTLAYIDFTNDIKERIGRPLTVEESFLASQMLYDIAKEPQCLYCYVSLDRKAYDGFLLEYIKQRDSVVAKYNALNAKAKEAYKNRKDKSNNKKDPLFKEFLGKRKATNNMRDRFNIWISLAENGEKLVSLADLTTEERRSRIKNNGGVMAEQMHDIEAYAQSASWAKKLEQYRSYNGEILRMSDDMVDLLNSEYGLRFYSFSEYTPAFIVENMQQIRDASVKGFKGLAYTKKTDFARIFAPTGMNINISVFGRMDKGEIVPDTLQGADWAEVQELRAKYDNVGAVYVATTDEMVDWALEQEWIDVVIPFHIVRTGANVAEFYKWVNHTSQQADRKRGRNGKIGKKADITPVEHNNDFATYKKLVEERNLVPRFEKWYGKENYMKLVNETRLAASETEKLKPNFDESTFKESKKSFDAFVEDGGYYGDWYEAGVDYGAAIDTVVDDILSGKRASEVDYGRQDFDASEAMKNRSNRKHGHQFSLESKKLTELRRENERKLAEATEADAQNENERGLIKSYKKQYNKVLDIAEQLDAAKQELSKAEADGAANDATKAQNRVTLLNRQYSREHKKLNSYQETKALQNVLSRVNERTAAWVKDAQEKGHTKVHPISSEQQENAAKQQHRAPQEVPKKDPKGKLTSKHVSTIVNSGITPAEFSAKMLEDAEQGKFSHIAYSDEEALAKATKKIETNGWEDALAEYKANINSGKTSKDITVMGIALYNNAVNNGDYVTAMDIASLMVKNSKTTAQALQAMRILNRLSPECRLYLAARSVENIQEELNERYKDNKADIHVDKVLYDEYANALRSGEEDKIKESWAKIEQNVAQQIDATWYEKLNQFRYLAMLGNPRTHIRNIVGNAFFVPVRAVKNTIAYGLETAADKATKGGIEKSKAILNPSDANDTALIKYANLDYDSVQDAIMGGGKYVDTFQGVDKYRTIYKKIKPLENLSKGNSKLLDKEDAWFCKPAYAHALAKWYKANGISAEQLAKGDVPEETIIRAQTTAIKEAQKATYRDLNWFSEKVSLLNRVKNKPTKVLVEGLMPFKKTPANILSRALEYSPAGLIKTLAVDTKKLKEYVNGDVENGMSPAQYIDNISSGLTGTALMGLGVLLASMGLLSGGDGDDEKQNNFDELKGNQNYALNVGGMSITLDWLAPESMPLFVGVELFNAFRNENENDDALGNFIGSLMDLADPMLEMSMLQSVSDLFDNLQNIEEGHGIYRIVSGMATSYITQYFPTLFGQVERAFTEEERETTYIDRNSKANKELRYLLAKIANKIPGYDYSQIPYIDAWGRRESTGNLLERTFNNFLNPAYVKEERNTPIDSELERLYELGETSVYPTRAATNTQIKGKYLTADEYVTYATEKGQISYDMAEQIINSSTYRSATDGEKAYMLETAYRYANNIAKYKVNNDYDVNGKWIMTAYESGNPAPLIIDHAMEWYIEPEE